MRMNLVHRGKCSTLVSACDTIVNCNTIMKVFIYLNFIIQLFTKLFYLFYNYFCKMNNKLNVSA